MSKGFYTVNLDGSASGKIPAPVIGENGNWWIGNDDTGIRASGMPGPKGDQGEPGPAGPKGDDGQAADMGRVEALEKQVAGLNSDFRLENACKKFVAGYDSVTEAAYIQFHLGNKTYQLTMDHTKMTYGKTENGKWATLWTK